MKVRGKAGWLAFMPTCKCVSNMETIVGLALLTCIPTSLLYYVMYTNLIINFATQLNISPLQINAA